MSSVKLIFGAGGIGEGRISHTWTTPEQTSDLLESLDELGLKQLDSAASYPPGSPWVTETLLGQAEAVKKGFVIDSKIMPRVISKDGRPTSTSRDGSLKEENIDACFQRTFELIGAKKVHIMYTHAPDPSTPAEESAKAFDKHFHAGHCEKIGLCNYTFDEMKEWLEICDQKGYAKPAFYQGHYNAICRHPETDLYPLLREHGVKINAYGPLAGGFLTGKVSLAADPQKELPGGRWTPGGHPQYPKTFDKPTIHKLMRDFCKTCDERGITSTEASLRWIMHHSVLGDGDGIILGASRIDQLKGNVEICWKEPLDEELLRLVDGLWDAAKDETHWN